MRDPQRLRNQPANPPHPINPDEVNYFVMDGRAIYDIDRASVLEALGQTPPGMSRLVRDWGNMDACLVKHTAKDGWEFIAQIA